MLGWSIPMLISVYRAFSLSHFIYNAIFLTSCSQSVKQEMNRYQERVLKLIGISQAEAKSFYNILPINERIDHICLNSVRRILNDPDHPFTTKIHKSPRSDHFIMPRFNKAAYRDSALLKSLCYLRDGSFYNTDVYFKY